MPYGISLPTFWTGTTGRQLQECGKDPVILAKYLSSNNHANMIGLYQIPIATILAELPVLQTAAAIDEALIWLDATEYAHYDRATSFTWVREMARVLLQLVPGEVCSNENRRRGAVNVYAKLSANPFLGPFYDRYAERLQLPRRREGSVPPPNGRGGGGKSLEATKATRSDS